MQKSKIHMNTIIIWYISKLTQYVYNLLSQIKFNKLNNLGPKSAKSANSQPELKIVLSKTQALLLINYF